jgi:hypothetical protein
MIRVSSAETPPNSPVKGSVTIARVALVSTLVA